MSALRRWWARQVLSFTTAYRHGYEAARAGMPFKEAAQHGYYQSRRALRKGYDKP